MSLTSKDIVGLALAAGAVVLLVVHGTDRHENERAAHAMALDGRSSGHLVSANAGQGSGYLVSADAGPSLGDAWRPLAPGTTRRLLPRTADPRADVTIGPARQGTATNDPVWRPTAPRPLSSTAAGGH